MQLHVTNPIPCCCWEYEAHLDNMKIMIIRYIYPYPSTTSLQATSILFS